MEQKKTATDKNAPVKLKETVAVYTFMKDGYPLIRNAVLIFAAVLTLSIALVATCRVILLRTEPVMAQAQAEQNVARDKFNQAENERIEIRDFLPKFEQLRDLGFYGNENRLFMLELIKGIQEERRLLPISYEFAPQQLVPVDPGLLATSLELHATKITLRFGLLHELDLFYFLRDLKNKGFYTGKECNIASVTTTALEPLAPRLTADCTLYWITIGEPPAVNSNSITSQPQ